MKRFTFITIFALLFTAFAVQPAHAQILGGSDFTQANEDAAEDKEDSDYSSSNDDTGFTGTYAEDDPNSQAFKDKELFGEDDIDAKPSNANEDDEDEDGDDEDIDDDSPIDNQVTDPTHLLKFDFEALVSVVDTASQITYQEVNYHIKIEQEIQAKPSRFRITTPAEIITDVVGELASNELFSCLLDIQFGERTPIEMLIRYNTKPGVDGEEGVGELAVKYAYNKSSFLEDWFSNCTGVDGSIFNTRGEKEKYLFVILESVLPELNGFLMENFDPEETNTVSHQSELFILEDAEDPATERHLTGEGKTTVEPIE